MNKKILFISIFILIVLSIGAVSAQDADDAVASSDDEVVLEDSEPTSSGSVSGGVNVVTENPWKTTGELSYDIPADAKTIKSADVYVNVYSGSAKNTYGANANITITTANGETRYNESLWIPDGSSDGTIYPVNDHTSKCYSDYMIHYNATSLLSGLNGTKLKINVDTFKYENKTFDGRIKLIGLVLAYDDGDDDVIKYWINDNQIWTNSNTTLTFDTTSMTNVLEMSLTNVALSSNDATYKINGEFLTDADYHQSGNYYQLNKWDITDYFNSTKKTQLLAIGTAGSYGVSYKNSLSVLTAKEGKTEVSASIATERKSTYDIVYPGTYNQIKVTVKTNKKGNYTVQLFADGTLVNSTAVSLISGTNDVIFIDPNERPIDENTAYPGSFNNVTYTAKIFLAEEMLNESSLKAAILYNGYFAKELSYPGQDYESFYNGAITGDIVIDVSKEDYVSKMDGRTDKWTVNLSDNSNFVKAWIYVGYSGATAKNVDLNVTFNGEEPAIVSFKRDQANVISTSGYGLIVYDVTDLIKSGENVFVINKTKDAGVYPSTLIYLYNATGSSVVKNVYISNGADLVGTYGNAAGRDIQINTTLAIDSSDIDGAVAYIFGAGSIAGRAAISINGEVDENVWADPANSINIYKKDIGSTVKDINNVSIVLKNSMFTSLQQIIVTTKLDNVTGSVSLDTERNYNGFVAVYPGTFNQITVTVNPNKPGKYVVQLLADGVIVNSTEISLGNTSTKVTLIDPTIRPITEATKSTGASGTYNKVNYTARLLFEDGLVNESSLSPNIVYNGYLNKEFSYDGQDYESFYNVTLTGDLVYMVSEQSYASGKNSRVDNWTVTLPANSNFVKAFVYVGYCYGSGDTIDLFNVTFNGAKPTPVSFKRDQANIPSTSGYGLVVYDVTDLIKSGINTFELNKIVSAGAYPSTLIYLYNTTGSNVVKNVYISNGADLVGMTGNGANRPIQVDTVLNINASDINSAVAYIFGAGCMGDRASIVVNGERDDNVWNTANDTNQINVYTKDISKTVKNSNNVSIILNHDMFTTLQQIIVTTKIIPVPTTITAPAVTITYNTNNKNLVVTLKDSNGNAVANAKLSINFNGKTTEVNTNANGQATLAIKSTLVPKTYSATITYAGDDTHIKSTAKANVVIKKASVKLTAKKKTFKAKVKTKKYTVTLKNNKGKVMKKVKLTLKVKGKTVKATTNSKGKATFKIKNLKKKGTFSAKITFKGDKYFNKLTKTVKIKVKK